MNICADACQLFVHRALDGMAAIVAGLGDELACTRPDLPGANSPYAILSHCLGVLSYWGGHVVGGRDVIRDRDAEFLAAGEVPQILAAVQAAKREFAADLAAAEPAAALRRPPLASTWDGPRLPTQGHALLHILEELAQHHGQAELTRDLLLASQPAR